MLLLYVTYSFNVNNSPSSHFLQFIYSKCFMLTSNGETHFVLSIYLSRLFQELHWWIKYQAPQSVIKSHVTFLYCEAVFYLLGLLTFVHGIQFACLINSIICVMFSCIQITSFTIIDKL